MNNPNAIREIESWLTRASGLPPAEEIQAIRRHLALIAAEAPALAHRLRLAEGLQMRAHGAVEALLPRLFNVRLPISNHTRLTVRAMQDALDGLIRLGLGCVEAPDTPLQWMGEPTEQMLHRLFVALRQHLMLSNLVSAPPGQGIWQALHRTYLATRRHRAEHKRPATGEADLQTLYARLLVAGALPPSALNAPEWAFLHRFLAGTRTPLEVSDTPEASTGSTIWASTEHDLAPTLYDRRAPGDGTLAVFVQCSGILAEIKESLSQLVQQDPQSANLPEDTLPRTARIALRRLRDHLSAPRKRRFPRRRQGYRSTLCVGFEDICALLGEDAAPVDALSEWMIVNESPGGYAAMHLSGHPRKAQVGDLVAVRREGESQWGICIVRWALSENPLHLEFGLEELSPRAIAGELRGPGDTGKRPPAALWLPALPPLRKEEALACAPASAPAREVEHCFVAAGPAEAGRRFRLGRPLEQASGIDVYLVTPLPPA